MNKAIFAVAITTIAGSSFATLIDFEDLTTGAVLSNQYAGVTFSGGIGPVVGLPSGPTGAWATNTDLTVVSSTGSDVGGLGSPAGTVSGNVIRSFNGWLGENGDAALLVTFADNVTDFSVAFAGISTSSSTRIFAVNADNTLGASAAATSTGQTTLSLAGLSGTNRILITPGDFFDWVGFDNINYTTNSVPEPATMAVLGLGAAALMRRRRSSK